jgi:CheY-like chemotaxis protein
MAVRVLVVDDEPPLRDLIRMVLEDEGYEVMTATNGAEALARAVAFEPNVILLDMSMPVMDGRAFVEAYRAKGPPPPLAPIIVVTAAGDAATRAVQLRAAGFIAKPFDIDQLAERVAKVAETSTAG